MVNTIGYMKQELLQELGFGKGETKIYLVLLERGTLTTGPIAKFSGITNSKVYKILDKLIIKGFVSYTLVGKIKHFQASEPRKILDLLKHKKEILLEKEKEFKNELPLLEEISNRSRELSKAEIFEGFNGLKTVFDSILGEIKKSDELLTIGIPPVEGQLKNYFHHFFRKQQKVGFKVRALFNQLSKDIAEERKNKFNKFRFMPSETITPTIINIYKNKTIINTRSKTEAFFTIVIDSKETASSFREYFEMLWKIAKS